MPGRHHQHYQVPTLSTLIFAFTLFAICLSFSSPPLLKNYKNICLFLLSLTFATFSSSFSLLLSITMGDFVVEKSEDGKIPSIEVPTNLDAKVFVLGHGNLLGKNIIQEFFNCVRNLPLDDASILKRTTN